MTAGSRAYHVVLLAVVLLATLLRVHDLRDLPPGFFCDEAGNGYNSYSLLETGRDENGKFLPLYIWSFGVAYKNPVHIYAGIGPVALFGLTESSVRLTSALFGILAVIGIAIVGRQLGGPATGLLAALLLAVCPWHLHFSRIAFELIAFPTVLLFAFAALIAGVRGKPWLLPVAGALFSLCLYTYGPAKLFVPLFVVAAVLLHFRRLWAALRWTLAAAVVTAAVAAPMVVFDLADRERSQQYLRNTTSWRSEQPLRQNLERFAGHYQRFFSQSFLFERGDPLVRHAVPGFGELHWAMAPLLAMGVLWALWPRNPEGKLILWWLLLYPIAPSLMNEIPSASRGFVGSVGFCLLAGCGAGAFLAAIRWALRRPWAYVPIQAVAVAALLAVLAQETWAYWQAYTTRYPAQAANDFQYGYRQAIDFLEQRRENYDLLMLTANSVNQPQIFAAFYRPVDPLLWQQGREASGYLIIHPAEFDRYQMNQRIAGAFREDDLRLFDDYTELTRILRPGGQVEYVIAEVHTRRRFLREWLLLGPFGPGTMPVDPNHIEPRRYDGLYGPAYWRRTTPQFVDVNLDDVYGRTAERAGARLSAACAFGLTRIDVPEDVRAGFEVSGAGIFRGWVNGHGFDARGTHLSRRPRRLPISLRAGENEILIQVCKGDGEWRFGARLVGDDDRDLQAFEIRPELPPRAEAAGEPTPPEQEVAGVAEVTLFDHHSERYGDYRGDHRGWWQHLGDANGAVEWRTAPIPERKPTAVRFNAAVGDANGVADLYVDGTYALSFETGRFRAPKRWQRGPWVLLYEPQERGHFLSGPWRLLVPASAVTPGQPLTLRVMHRDGSRHAFFMIKGDSPGTR